MQNCFKFYLILMLDLNITPTLAFVYLFYHSCLFTILMWNFYSCISNIIEKKKHQLSQEFLIPEHSTIPFSTILKLTRSTCPDTHHYYHTKNPKIKKTRKV